MIGYTIQIPGYVDKLNHGDNWSRTLSLGEQQRISIVRAILNPPDFLFLDEATSALDATSEEYLYQLVKKKCPQTCLISVGHRSSLKAWHDTTVEL